MKYVDFRTVTVNNQDRSVFEPATTATIVRWSEGTDVDLDDIPNRFVKEFGKVGGDGYTITDSRTIFERGASAAQQDILVQVMNAALDGAAAVVIAELVQYAKSQYLRSRNTRSPQSETAGHLSQEAAVSNAREFLRTQFGAIDQNLKVTAMEDTGDSVHLSFRESQNSQYEVEISKDGILQRATRRGAD